MKIGFIVIAGIAFLGLFAGISYYYICVLKRWCAYFLKDKAGNFKPAKWIFRIAGIGLSVCTINFFSVTGVFLLYFLAVSLFMELINKAVNALFAKKEKKIWEWIYRSLLVSFVATLGIMGYGYYNIHHIVKTEYTVYSDKVSKDYDIVFLADVHYGTILGKEELEDVCDRISKEQADFVILGGDIVDEATTKEQMEEAFAGLGKILQTDGIYYVDGNHDRQQYSEKQACSDEEYVKILEDNKIQYLKDEVVPIADEILLVGRKDYSNKQRATMEHLLSGEDPTKYIISADHQPVEYEASVREGVDLNVSGHTHGGQLFPVGFAIKLLKTADLYYGHETWGQMEAVVTSGLCGWGYPVRTQKHCEYVVIHVRSGEK